MSRTYRLSWLLLILSVSVVTPASADTFYAYSQGGIPPGDLFTWCDAQETEECNVSEPVFCNTPEGGSSMRVITNVWGGFGVFPVQNYDLSSYANGGELRFWINAPADGNVKIEFKCEGLGYGQNLVDHGWSVADAGQWKEISIPVCDFFGGTCEPAEVTCLQSVEAPFMTTLENLTAPNGMLVDYVRWISPNTHTGATTVEVDGRQFKVNGEPFAVNGMAYAPVAICENWQSAWADRADRYSVDFPAIAASGANTVRLYAPITSSAMLDAASAAGLYVMPTFGIDPVQLTCPEGRQFAKDRFEEMVLQWGDHPAILAWLVGNEFNVNTGGTDLCTDWYTQVDAMAQVAHLAEGTSAHPVGTANADTTGLADICQSGCSDDTAMPNLDFWAAQIYRGCSLSSAFSDYGAKSDCGRPLVITEFGMDAWDSGLGAENETLQAGCMSQLLDSADAALAVRTPGGVSAGQVVFEWADEWWKAEGIPPQCDPTTDWCAHDSCASFTNPSYPDSAINEEYWGMVSLDSGNANLRGTRQAYDRVSDAWNLGDVCDQRVASFDSGTGNTTISFDPAPGSTDHTLYAGLLNDVSSYAYNTTITALGATGSSSFTLPAGSLYWVVVGRNHAAEGGYGTGVAERPAAGGAAVPQSPNRTGLCMMP